jgi:predicted NUDIX family NTP pyrophosphohydrolase
MKRSAGILIYRLVNNEIHVLLAKCGGPNWKKYQTNVWNIPKGRLENNESDLSCALREFREETSLVLPDSITENEILDLGIAKTSAGKMVRIFAINYDFAGFNKFKVKIQSNLCEIEWPRKSGKKIYVPELDETAYYFKLNVAKRLIFPYQCIFLNRLENILINN